MSCGTPVTAAAPAQPDAEPAPPPSPSVAAPPPPVAAPPPPVAAPPPVTPPPVAPQPVAPPPFAGGPAVPKPGGISRNTVIGIAVVVVLALVIAFFVRQSEREFQRQRRAEQTSGSRTITPSSLVQPNAGAPGSEDWTRSQIADQWSGSRDCRDLMEFRADGTTIAGSVRGTWTFQGRYLTVVEPSATTVFELVSMGTAEMVTQVMGHRQVTWYRC